MTANDSLAKVIDEQDREIERLTAELVRTDNLWSKAHAKAERLTAEISRLRSVMQEKNNALQEAWATIRDINQE